jgi:hypothetical protein
MYSPARINKLLVYPRANADNPVVPWPAFKFLSKLQRNLWVLFKEQSVFHYLPLFLFFLFLFFLIPRLSIRSDRRNKANKFSDLLTNRLSTHGQMPIIPLFLTGWRFSKLPRSACVLIKNNPLEDLRYSSHREFCKSLEI